MSKKVLILSGAEGDIHYSYYGLVGETAHE